MDPIEEAELAVIAGIFRHDPRGFVWIGGSLLHLLHRSPRESFDIGLVPREKPNVAGLEAIITKSLSDAAGILGISLHVAAIESSDDFMRITVSGPGESGFSIDLTRIAGSIRATETVIIRSPTGTAAVTIPTGSSLLASKLRALLLRRFPKPGDLFDVWFLLEEGTALEKPDRAALEDELYAGGIDTAEVERRLSRFRGKAWIRALTRSGVTGLTDETAGKLLDRVQRFVGELVQ